MSQFIIDNLIQRKFKFNGKKGTIQFWKSIPAQKGQYLTVIDQPFRYSQNNRALENHRELCRARGNFFVGPETEIDDIYLFAGIAAQRGFADIRTCYDPDQIMGQLVVPVYDLLGVLVGVIELYTYNYLLESYAADFNQIHRLLKEGNLETKPMKKTIKAVYGPHMIKFSLPFSSGITCLWNEVRMRFKSLNRKDFRISYQDHSGGLLPIFNDADLWACMAKSSSMTIMMFISK